MAALRKIVFALLFESCCFGAIRPAADTVRTGFNALIALKQCQTSQSILWAQNIDTLDSQLGVLYRLAWLQRQQGNKPKETPQFDRDDYLLWPQTSEFWRDERVPADGTACFERAEPVDLSEIPSGVLKEAVEPLFSSPFSKRRALRSVLRDYALFAWTNGTKIKISFPPSGSELTSSERCGWLALNLLGQKGAIKSHDYDIFFEECPSMETERTDLLTAVTNVEAGDQYLKENKTGQASKAYRTAFAYFSKTDAPSALWYRIAVSGLLAKQADDKSLRAAFRVLFDKKEDERNSVSPLLASSLQNILCDRLGELSAGDAVRLLSAVFAPKELVDNGIAVTEACSQVKDGVLETLLKRTSNPRDKVRLLGHLLASAVSHGPGPGRARAVVYTKTLAELSHRIPFAASHYFWKALENGNEGGDLVAIYHRVGDWRSGDDYQSKRWKAKRSSPTVAQLDHLKVEQLAGQTPVTLPVALSIPSLVWKERIAVDFISGYEQDLAELERATGE